MSKSDADIQKPDCATDRRIEHQIMPGDGTLAEPEKQPRFRSTTGSSEPVLWAKFGPPLFLFSCTYKYPLGFMESRYAGIESLGYFFVVFSLFSCIVFFFL